MPAVESNDAALWRLTKRAAVDLSLGMTMNLPSVPVYREAEDQKQWLLPNKACCRHRSWLSIAAKEEPHGLVTTPWIER